MKNKRKICAALMLISFISRGAMATADDEIVTGSCYDSEFYDTEHCVWELNKSNGTIVFKNLINAAVSIPVIDEKQRWSVKEGVIADGTKKIYHSPFRSFPNLKNVSLPDTLTYIGALMYDCPQIEELTFSGEFKIGRACTRCDGLKTINLGRLVYFGSYPSTLAYLCPNLNSVNVDEWNESFRSVNGALLQEDEKILNVFPFGRTSKAVIPYGVEETMQHTFSGCPFTSVTIPETVKTINDAFEGCNNLSTINFFGTQEPKKHSSYEFCGAEVINVPHDYNGDTLWGYPVRKVIDHHGYMSDGCTYWMTQDDDTQITIGGDGDLDRSLLADDGSTWSAVKDKIKKVNIDEGITTIDMSIFSGCENLSEVSLPRSVKNVTSLNECSNLASIIVPDDNDSYSTVDGVLFSKNSTELIHYPSGKSSSSYKIPEGTTTICSNAFSDCKNLQEVTLPESIDRVEADAFSENSSLETLNYMGKNPPNYDFTFKNPPIVQVWTDYNGDELFGVKVSKVFEAGVHGDISWVLGPESTLTVEGVGVIERNNPWDKFKKSAKKLVIEEGITSLDVAAFYGYDFTDIKLPDTLETIGWSAFNSCRQLTNVVLPSGVKSIGKKAFQGCENLESITLNEGLEEIGENAFDGCKNLHSITLPKSVKKIEDAALRNSALTEIHVADGNDFYYDFDGVLFSKPDLALVQYPTGQGGHYTVPENVTKINDSAFACAEDLESVTIQGSLKSIGSNAFYGCYNLKSVHIDGEVERIDNSAFAFCKSFRVLEYNGEPKLGEDVFFGCGVPNQTPAWKLSNIFDGPIASAIYANGLWVARPEISKTGDLYLSKDGRSWSTIPVAAERLNFVTHENGLWVAGGPDGMYYSTDGETWTKTNISGNCSFATHANGMWVSGGYGGDEYEGLYYSVDGKSWTSVSFPGSSCDMAEYANGVWVLSGLSSDTGLYYSTDGMTWTQSNVTTGGFQTITYTDGLWHAGGYNSGTGLYYSTDGKTWTLSNLPSGKSSFNDYGTYSVITKANDVWVTGEFGHNNYCTGLYYSADGKNWTQSNVDSGSFEFIVNANGLWVAGSNGTFISNRGLYYSTDGKTWTQSNITSGTVRFVENANDMWIAGIWDDDDNYKNCGLYYSMDGKTWIKSNVSDQGTTFATNANGLWVASGYDGLYYSTVLCTFT